MNARDWALLGAAANRALKKKPTRAERQATLRALSPGFAASVAHVIWGRLHPSLYAGTTRSAAARSAAETAIWWALVPSAPRRARILRGH